MLYWSQYFRINKLSINNYWQLLTTFPLELLFLTHYLDLKSLIIISIYCLGLTDCPPQPPSYSAVVASSGPKNSSSANTLPRTQSPTTPVSSHGHYTDSQVVTSNDSFTIDCILNSLVVEKLLNLSKSRTGKDF